MYQARKIAGLPSEQRGPCFGERADAVDADADRPPQQVQPLRMRRQRRKISSENGIARSVVTTGM